MFSINMHGLNLWKKRKGKAVLNAFIEIINESNRKSNRLLVDQGREFCKNGYKIMIFKCTPHMMKASQ